MSIKTKIILLLLLLTYTISLKLIGITCPLYELFHLPCLTCGMTRAMIACLHFDFKLALYYHPLVFTLPILLCYFLNDFKLAKKTPHKQILLIIAVAFVINWFYKLILII